VHVSCVALSHHVRKLGEANRYTATSEVAKTDEKQSWSDWIGGYSMSVAKFMKDIEAEAAIEETHASSSSARIRPSGGPRKQSTPSSKPPNQTSGAISAKDPPREGVQRPPLKQTGSGSRTRLSQQQVETLMA
jgi:hypothetical protein